jgi:hypothetical protein
MTADKTRWMERKTAIFGGWEKTMMAYYLNGGMPKAPPLLIASTSSIRLPPILDNGGK